MLIHSSHFRDWMALVGKYYFNQSTAQFYRQSNNSREIATRQFSLTLQNFKTSICPTWMEAL